MDKLIGMAMAPFFVLACLTIGYPIIRAVKRMKDGRLKRFLLISW